jgi:hypothetical protein
MTTRVGIEQLIQYVFVKLFIGHTRIHCFCKPHEGLFKYIKTIFVNKTGILPLAGKNLLYSLDSFIFVRKKFCDKSNNLGDIGCNYLIISTLLSTAHGASDKNPQGFLDMEGLQNITLFVYCPTADRI